MQVLNERHRDHRDRPCIVAVNRNLCGRAAAVRSSALRVTASAALSGGGFVRGCPGTPHHCPSLCPDNVICLLSTEYQVSVRSTEINLMSPEDM